MRTLWIISTSIALLVSFNSVGSRAVQFGATAQQEQQKEKDDSKTKVSGELGSKTNPVRCSGPPGERVYLNRLRCSDGKPRHTIASGVMVKDHTVAFWMDTA